MIFSLSTEVLVKKEKKNTHRQTIQCEVNFYWHPYFCDQDDKTMLSDMTCCRYIYGSQL